ncbi:MAG: rod shape-determining protein MreC [Desulfarculaceae bacterium]|nr:rod shape-determining protein MreC [Desulfarculaceae bacterium]MCF8073635.1 rod shape-determining protein MreC [Desulfarculaceae bacterium]MCF8103133.1 rod shape-determining protein MreC [Desulfarculaceae bacterium]MCF8115649.1 rod shape-determining protein MreC [Desulfarculaceae bacterium]
MNFFHKYRFPIIVALFLLGALAYFSFSAGKGIDRVPGGRYVMELVGPAQRGVTGVGQWFNSIWRRYFALVQAAEENERLRKQLAALGQRVVDRDELELANRRLNKLLNFQKGLDYPMAAAEVMGDDPSGRFQTVIVNKGSAAGVEPLMPVVNAEGVVGRVIWASPHYAKLLLLIDANSAVDVLVQRNRARGIVEGGGGGVLRLKYVIHTADVAVGDKLITSGAAGVFPKGVLVGTVSAVHKEKDGAFQRVEVSPAVDFGRLEEVLIILHRRNLDG